MTPLLNTLPTHCQPVPLDKAYRLMNHGPTVLVSATHGGVSNVMAAAWACVLDFTPPKVTVVLDKATATRGLIEASGQFALQLPTRAMASMTTGVGTDSAHTVPDKLARHGVAPVQRAGLRCATGAGLLWAGWCANSSPSHTTSRSTTCSLAK
jgi:flavin reductase (DIM6/NTAB) family NADH-FMN oxidoreductase RutF